MACVNFAQGRRGFPKEGHQATFAANVAERFTDGSYVKKSGRCTVTVMRTATNCD